MDIIRELTVSSMMLRIMLALILGGVLGFERGLKNRPAGLRTYILVCVGACIVMMTNQYVFQAFHSGDPVRMAAQVISGIGFLGAGTIIVTSRNQIKGLTTAAGLWASACLGLAIGIGLYEIALFGGLTIFIVLNLLNKWDFFIRNRTRSIDVYVELSEESSIADFSHDLRILNIEIHDIQIEHKQYDKGVLAFVATIRGTRTRTHDEIIRILRHTQGVCYIEEL